VRDFAEGGSVPDHGVGDAGELLYERRNPLLGIHERIPLRHPRRPDFDDANFSNAIDPECSTRGFQVDKHQGLEEKGVAD
jgi:hypothetical protein